MIWSCWCWFWLMMCSVCWCSIIFLVYENLQVQNCDEFQVEECVVLYEFIVLNYFCVWKYVSCRVKGEWILIWFLKG